MVSIPRWKYDANGLASYHGFYMPVPVEPGEDFDIEVTPTYLEAMEKYLEAMEKMKGSDK
jgi:hypothetical protein